MSKVRTGQAAPAFKLVTAGGETLSLADALAHGPVVVSFFKTTCPTCQFTFPFIECLYKAYGGEQITLWGISQDDAADTEEFCAE
jgi:peroxiredoxin